MKLIHKHHNILLVVLCVGLTTALPLAIQAQNHAPSAAGARGMATGTIRTVSQDVNSTFGNQAGLAALENTSLTVFGENRFLLSDVSQFSLAAGLPTNSGTFGLAVQYFGFEDYNEQKLGLAYARKLADKFLVGVQLDYLNVRIPEYGNQGNLTFEVGVQAELHPQLLIGTHIFSPVQISWTDNDDYVPTVFAIGASYRPSKKLSITAEVEKDFEFPVNAKFGIDYQIIDQLSLRLGGTTFPVQNTFGIGLHLNNIDIDVATLFHQTLGVSTGVSVSYEL